METHCMSKLSFAKKILGVKQKLIVRKKNPKREIESMMKKRLAMYKTNPKREIELDTAK